MAEVTKEKDSSERNRTVDSSWWNSWGQGWVDAVKEKSAITLEMVKRDLSEFVDVIQGDTLTVISETASKLDDNSNQEQPSTSAVVKKGISKFLHTVSDLITSEPDDTKDELITISDSFSIESYNRKQEMLLTIQIDPGTYCNEPEGLFMEWLDAFNLDDHKSEMSELLIHNSNVRAIYTQLVPAVVSHTTFWQRYFYKVHLLESEEKRRSDVLARVTAEDSNLNDCTDGGWEDDDDGDGDGDGDGDDDEDNKDSASSNKLTANQNEDNLIDEVLVTNSEEDNLSQTNIINVLCPEVPIINEDTFTHESANIVQKLSDSCSQVKLSEDLDEEVQIVSIGLESSAHLDTNEEQDSSNSNINPSICLPKEINHSCETIDSENFPECSKTINEIAKKIASPTRVQQLQNSYLKNELSETSSLSSWMSIDDDIKVKIAGDLSIKESSGSDSSTSAVLVNKVDSDELDEGDFDIDLDEDVNDEELQKLVLDIKNKSISGNNQDNDDDDWENWE